MMLEESSAFLQMRWDIFHQTGNLNMYAWIKILKIFAHSFEKSTYTSLSTNEFIQRGWLGNISVQLATGYVILLDWQKLDIITEMYKKTILSQLQKFVYFIMQRQI